MSEPLLNIRDLSKNYGDFVAVDRLNFKVFPGDVFGFLGPNGAGKSTTIRMILSLIRPASGDIEVFGKSLRIHRREILSKIGCIVEKPDFYGFLSAETNLRILAQVSGVAVPKTKIYETLELVGLKGRERDKVRGYSHGMKQRLGIAQTLIHDPELIILDEPTTGLDPQGIIDIRNLINHLRIDRGKTVVLSSHILSEIELIATRMVIINKGKAVAEGSVTDLLNARELVVSFQVDASAKALNILSKLPAVKEALQLPDETIVVQTSQEDIPVINQALVGGGVRVYAIESRRKLEDYFLKLVSEA